MALRLVPREEENVWEGNVNRYFDNLNKVKLIALSIGSSEEQVDKWLETYHTYLQDKPKELIRTARGMRRVTEYLSVLERLI